MEHKTYDFAAIEKKWQERWEKEKIFEVKENPKKKKYYSLEQYPYPSGSGLHMGHTFIYTIGDIHARFKRMQGFNVLHPIGYDSFGLPAENAAIKNKSHPKKFTEDAIKNFTNQMKRFGFSYDWSRKVECHKPEYYKWDQWIFLQMLKKGLAYKKTAPVNWCPKCNTVLANEQVVQGKCWRHEDTEVEIKHLEQWYLRITKYADELYENLDNLPEWPNLIKAMQKNWIGKSHGYEIEFEINGKKWPIFTTRPDTLFGVTFMVVSAQHPYLMELVTKEQKKQVETFLKKIKTVSQKSMKEVEDLDKEGAFTGSYAINPSNGEKVPVYTGNFVVADYGCGMVMAVPAHDQRDFEFAKKYKIPIKVVIKPFEYELNAEKMSRAFTGEGELINSGEFDYTNNLEAIDEIGKKFGKKIVNYKLRDWLISRQRFWGTPIPIIYCDKCGAMPVPEKDLPVILPDDVKFASEKNPLIADEKFVKTKCPMCGKSARRETDTMDTFVNSSWYYLRYCDSKNEKEVFDKKKVDYWLPIDIYVGGKEHATMHDIYFRFYYKFLRDLGLVEGDEPAKRLFVQGFIYGPDGRKMSKSYGNVVVPDDAANKFGVDATRLFLVSVALPEKDLVWSDKGAEGSLRFIENIVDYVENVKIGKTSDKVQHKINKAIKEINEDVETMKYSLAVIKLRELYESFEKEISKKDLENFIKMLSPFIPFIAEELWESIGNKPFVSLADWPVCDETKINGEFDKIDQAIDNTVADVLNVLKIIKEKQGKEGNQIYLYVIPKEKELFDSEAISRRVGKKVETFAVNDPKKYDPQGKAQKAKPGKPAIYVE